MADDESLEGSQAPSARAWVESVLGAQVLEAPELIQELWSGYGRIERLSTDSPVVPTVVLKAVEPPLEDRGHPRGHPRGWGTDRSHARKLRSYEVEAEFYRAQAGRLVGGARVPRFLGGKVSDRGSFMLLEDLDAAGFSARRQTVTDEEVQTCLDWLAGFHATFLGMAPTGLWERGTYWHLATRPDELAATANPELVQAAPKIDARLGGARHRTLVHGDAKLANFCFPEEPAGSVAALDFQYVGGGVGVQDVAYFLGSCFGDEELDHRAAMDLDHYFRSLRAELEGAPADALAVEVEWRELWPFAWADFHRFLAGWSPGHWKLSRYSEAMLESALHAI